MRINYGACDERYAEVAFNWRGQIVTTEFVLVEFGNHLCHPTGPPFVLPSRDVFRCATSPDIVKSSRPVFPAISGYILLDCH